MAACDAARAICARITGIVYAFALPRHGKDGGKSNETNETIVQIGKSRID